MCLFCHSLYQCLIAMFSASEELYYMLRIFTLRPARRIPSQMIATHGDTTATALKQGHVPLGLGCENTYIIIHPKGPLRLSEPYALESHVSCRLESQNFSSSPLGHRLNTSIAGGSRACCVVWEPSWSTNESM